MSNETQGPNEGTGEPVDGSEATGSVPVEPAESAESETAESGDPGAEPGADAEAAEPVAAASAAQNGPAEPAAASAAEPAEAKAESAGTEAAAAGAEAAPVASEPKSAAHSELPADDETRRIDEIPVDVGEPEPAVESSDVMTGYDRRTEYGQEPYAGYDAAATETYPAEYAGAAAGGAAAGGAAAGATAAGAEAAAPSVTPTPVYVTAPTPPKAKGNRLMGILIAVVGAVAYAVVFAVVTLGLFALRQPRGSVTLWENYLQTAGFWVPVVVFFLAFVLLIVIVNRGGWWAYGIGSFFVGVIVYFGYVGGALLTVSAWKFSSGEVTQFLGTLWSSPLTFAAAVVALETSLWFGAWVAARGRRVRERNLEAQRDYDRRIQAGPTA
ncbi:hypothetical protein [Humibacter soli]